MALSMDEQRILAEIEQHLAKAEPALAARMASFGRPGSAHLLRSPRVRILAACVVLVAVTVVSLIAYALLPLRAMPDRGSGGRPPPRSPPRLWSAPPAPPSPGARRPPPPPTSAPA